MTHMESIEGQAEMVGREHGVNAASWFFNGGDAQFVVEATLKGIMEIDPMVMDSLPQSPLSGEWADSFSLRDLADELGVDVEDADTMDAAATAYEEGFHSAVVATIESACIDYLRGAGVEVESL